MIQRPEMAEIKNSWRFFKYYCESLSKIFLKQFGQKFAFLEVFLGTSQKSKKSWFFSNLGQKFDFFEKKIFWKNFYQNWFFFSFSTFCPILALEPSKFQEFVLLSKKIKHEWIVCLLPTTISKKPFWFIFGLFCKISKGNAAEKSILNQNFLKIFQKKAIQRENLWPPQRILQKNHFWRF